LIPYIKLYFKNTHVYGGHTFCTNVYLTTKGQVVNLDNDEIKRVLVMLVASCFLNKVTGTRNILDNFLGDMYLYELCSIMSFYKSQNFERVSYR